MNPAADLISTPDAARLMGVTESDFTRLVDALNIEAAVPGTKETPRQWRRAEIEALNRGPEGAEVRESAVRYQAVRAMVAGLEARFPDWTAALRPACAAMFNFNRMAKWAACTPLRRRQLYQLKDRVIRLLYRRGHCRSVESHMIADEPEECASCVGVGTDWRGEPCAGCKGTGVLVPTQAREFVMFVFDVDGQVFRWHSPRKAIEWEFTLAAPPRDFGPKHVGDKPIQIAPEQFDENEALLHFVIRMDRREEEAKEKIVRDAERKAIAERMRKEGLERQAKLREERRGE